ncbi:MAG: TonB-dependent receptor [Mucilaginibacter sp.]|nr:TonB-dependent receptor [Mucilaginibacter sp.]
MNLKIATFLAAWLTIASTFVYAQSSLTLSGKVIAVDGKALAGAAVYLNRAADSVLIKTALADAAGNYLFENLKKGDYKLSITMVGYPSYKSALIRLDQDKILPVIALQQGGTMLKEVSVTSQRPLVEHQIDRTVVNVDALISNAGATAMDVLEKSPGVFVDQNGAISLKGKSGVQIFIDGKPTYLSGTDLENYLRSLSASSIDQVELMPNPPAKYDAAGTGGVINIRTKKSKIKGFNGGINLSLMQGVYTRTNNSFNFNYRNNKINLFGNLAFSSGNGYSDLNINRHFLNTDGSVTSNFVQNSFIRRTPKNYNTKIGLDYYASDKTTLGIGLTGMIIFGNFRTHSASKLSDATNTLDSTIIANNNERRNFKNGGINLNYRHQYDKSGRELTADMDYLTYRTNNNQLFNNISYLPDGSITNNDILTGHLPGNIQIYSAKADYTHPLNNGLKLAAGVKTSYTKTDNIADYFSTIDNITTPDYDKTNHFIYKEQINAGYININKDWKRFAIQIGLRFENTTSDGHQLGNVQKPDSVFKRNYNGLFPTVYLQYKLDTAGHQTIGLNYGRRIDRPSYNSLNPFLSPLDKFTYYAGNPFLKPSYTNKVELSHTWKNITTTFSYSKTKDDVNETIEIVDGIYYSRPGNLGHYTDKGVDVDATFDPAKWLNFHLFASLHNLHTVSDFYTGGLNTQGIYCFIQPVWQFKLPKDWTIQLDGYYRSKLTNAQFTIGSRKRINTAISKKLSPSTTIKLVLNDLFKTDINNGMINNLANTRADFRNVVDTRSGVISLSYRFGKTIAGQRKHDTNGAESEKSRVGN